MSDLARKQSQEPEERIWTLRQLMAACRARVPEILRQIDHMFADPTMSSNDRLKLMDMVLDRGFGKPAQMLRVSEENMRGSGGSAVKVYIPDNRRNAGNGPTIDAQTLEPVADPLPDDGQQQVEINIVEMEDDPLDEIESAEVIPWKRDNPIEE